MHLYGQPADMAAITGIAGKHGLRVVGDAAQAHGARIPGTADRQLADYHLFQFLSGQEPGCLRRRRRAGDKQRRVGGDARMMANHGRTKKYDHDFEGVNSRLDGLQAAILSVKLRHLAEWTQRRRANCATLQRRACRRGYGHSRPRFRACEPSITCTSSRVPDGKRDALQEYLKAQGISTGIHYPIALPYLKAYAYLGHTPADFPESRQASAESCRCRCSPNCATSRSSMSPGKSVHSDSRL